MAETPTNITYLPIAIPPRRYLGVRAAGPHPPVCHSPHWFPSRPHRPWERGLPAHTRWCVTPPIGSHHARTAPGSAGRRPTPAGVSLPPLVPITPAPPLGARAAGPHPPVSPIGSHHAHAAPGSAGLRPTPAGVPPLVPITPTPPLGARASGPPPPVCHSPPDECCPCAHDDPRPAQSQRPQLSTLQPPLHLRASMHPPASGGD